MNYKRLILNGQEKLKKANPLKRDIPFNYEYLQLDKIITFVGPRRAGKTYFMFYILKKLIEEKKIQLEQVVFIDFTSFLDNEFDVEKLLEDFYLLYPDKIPFFVFDEIQELKNFEKIVMYLFNMGFKIFLSGSNSKLLSSQLSTIFRGRTIDIKVLPLSFKEFLYFKWIGNKFYTEQQLWLVKNKFLEYLKFGGYPEIVLAESEITKLDLINQYFTILLYKDLLERYGIENEYVIKYLIKRILYSVSKEFSIQKVFNDLKSQWVKVGKQTIYNYLEYLKEIFFVYEVLNLAKQWKKFFLYDVWYNNVYLIENYWYRFENIVLNHLKQKFEVLFYLKQNNYEIDFVLKEVNLAIQVCYELNEENFEREIYWLKKVKCKNKYLIYFNKFTDKTISDIKIINIFESLNLTNDDKLV